MPRSRDRFSAAPRSFQSQPAGAGAGARNGGRREIPHTDHHRFPHGASAPRVVRLGAGRPAKCAALAGRSDLAVLLAMGDALAAIKYQGWAGLHPGGKNLLGFDPADRHTERVLQSLDWLEERATSAGFLPESLSVQDVTLASFMLWTEARGGFAWRGRPKVEAIVARCAERPSFQATKPQPWP